MLEEHPDGNGGLFFHKKKESTVQFHVQWLDRPEHQEKYPSFSGLEERGFVSQTLGDMDTWCVAPMTYGEKSEVEPKNHPKAAAFKATLIDGGLVFMMHHHHYANDVMGWAGELHQLAENCATIWKTPENPLLPTWNPACLDSSRVTAADVPEDQQVDRPVSPLKHTDHKVDQWLLFHLPKRKTAELKRLATPADGSFWVSSYDARTFVNLLTAARKRTWLLPAHVLRNRLASRPTQADFGFAKPYAFHFHFDTASAGLAVVLPARTGEGAPAGEDEGSELCIAFEKEIAKDLIEDLEWKKYFEFSGVDSEERESQNTFPKSFPPSLTGFIAASISSLGLFTCTRPHGMMYAPSFSIVNSCDRSLYSSVNAPYQGS
ncbi:hypothetical protein B0H67DRAFT_671147 [Lasiosphaeris hirsuta]|uniref:Trichothecene 3-O-acetyltransferase-like N-terminal domain-containing protein n=1 Tax=Lasiosphaeris hirsuta TaxID=260670 RepID=A0AA40A1X3_9PEZI|nr:hypothetical protein B0H67DRAFT_671147 [Lasiosphaeris hirsuta]